MTGTFGGALEARGIDASDGRLTGEVTGEVELTEDGVLRIARIHVRYRLLVDDLDEEGRAKIDRAYRFHPPKCPIHRSIGDQIPFTTELEVVET